METSKDLREALSEFAASGTPELPVLDDNGGIVALIKLHEIVAFYAKPAKTQTKPSNP